MKRLLLIGICLILWAFSTSLKAQIRGGSEAQVHIQQFSENHQEPGFSHRLTGSLTLLDGTEQEIDMILSFQRGKQGWYFRAGDAQIQRDTPPSAYFINIILDSRGYAYIRDFTDQLVIRLTLNIEGHQIELFRTEGEGTRALRLRLNERQFLFEDRHPRLRLDLNENGVYNIVAERTLRDLSIRRVQ